MSGGPSPRECRSVECAEYHARRQRQGRAVDSATASEHRWPAGGLPLCRSSQYWSNTARQRLSFSAARDGLIGDRDY